MRRSTLVSPLLLALALLPASLVVAAWDLATGIRVEPTKTWVGPARVHLEVSELTLHESALEGRYSIRVPMAPSQNDSGTIRIDVAGKLDEVRRSGGLLSGSAVSEEGKTSAVTCDFRPDGRVRIEVSTDRRNLSFNTRYYPLDRS